jgi:hypothetical protein
MSANLRSLTVCFLSLRDALELDQGFVAQQPPQCFDLLCWPRGEIGQGALDGFLAFAPTLAQEDGGRGAAIGDSFYVHGIDYAYLLYPVKTKVNITWEHYATRSSS